MLEIWLGTLTLRIAGHGDLGDLERQYEPHSVSGAIDPDGVVEVRIDRTLAHHPSADSLSPLRAWSVTGSSLKITAEMWEATVALTPGGATHVVMRAWGAWEFDLLMGCLLQVMGPVYGLGLVVHGSAVVRDGRGYVFFAPSETGKSTVAQLSRQRGYSVLAEEMSFIGLPTDAHGPTVHRLPLRERNEVRCEGSLSAPLCGLYRLVQSPDDRIEPLDRRRSILELAGAAAIGARAPLVMDAALGSIVSLLGFIEPSRLHFTRSPRFWDVIDAVETKRTGVDFP